MISINDILQRKAKIAVIGLGYVGLPLAAAFGHKVDTIGFDIDDRKMAQLLDGFDTTGELSSEQLAATQIVYTTDPARKNNLCTRKAPNQLLEALSSSDRSLFLVSLSV